MNVASPFMNWILLAALASAEKGVAAPLRRLSAPNAGNEVNLVPKDGSPASCRCEKLTLVAEYSAGAILRCTNCLDVYRSNDKDSCPAGTKIFSPQNSRDWRVFWDSGGAPLYSPNWIIDVTRPENGCGGCTKGAMNSSVPEQSSWKTSDGSPWWLRSTIYNQPSGDYAANCYLNLLPNGISADINFNDMQCAAHANAYYCQPQASTFNAQIIALWVVAALLAAAAMIACVFFFKRLRRLRRADEPAEEEGTMLETGGSAVQSTKKPTLRLGGASSREVTQAKSSSQKAGASASANYNVLPSGEEEGGSRQAFRERFSAWCERRRKQLEQLKGTCKDIARFSLFHRLHVTQESVHRSGLYFFPNNVREVVKMIFSAALFYSDIISDCLVVFVYLTCRQFWLMLYTILAIGAAIMRARHVTGFMLVPWRLTWQAMKTKASAAANHAEWIDTDLSESSMRMQKLTDLRIQMWRVTRLEAETEAPLCLLVQLNSLFFDSYDWHSTMVLVTSAFISFLSLLYTLCAFDEHGHATWTTHMQHPHGKNFPYVSGPGLTPVSTCGILAFRALELFSRVGTLASIQAVIAQNDKEDFGVALIFPVLLGLSSIILFAMGEAQYRPQHGIHCLQGSFFFPGPLLLPPFVKASVVSYSTFYLFRTAENLLPWVVMFPLMHAEVIQPLPTWPQRYIFRGAYSWTVTFAGVTAYVLYWARRSDHTRIREELCSHVPCNKQGRVLWPVASNGGAYMQRVLEGYGFHVTEALEDAKGDAIDIQWCINPKASEKLHTPNVMLTRESQFVTMDLDEQSPSASDLQNLFWSDPRRPVQRVRFLDCDDLEPDGWRAVSSGFQAAHCAEHILELGFRGSLHPLRVRPQRRTSMVSLNAGVAAWEIEEEIEPDIDKAIAITEILVACPNLKKLDLSKNERLSHASWGKIVLAVRGYEIEELGLDHCSLDTEKVAIIAEGLNKLPNIRKIKLGFNVSLSAKGWGILFKSCVTGHALAQASEIGLQAIDLDAAKVKEIATALAHLKMLRVVDLGGNTKVAVPIWKSLLGELATTKVKDLRLSHGSLDNAIAGEIGNALKNAGHLHHLDFSWTKLSVESWSQLLNSLASLKHLHELCLHHCEFDESEAEVIIELLHKFTALWKLNISHNPLVTSHAWRYLSTCPQLSHLNLEGCHITQDIRNTLLASMATKKLKHGTDLRLLCDPKPTLGVTTAPCGTEARSVRTLRLDLRNQARERAEAILVQFLYTRTLVAKITSEQASAMGLLLQHGSLQKLDITGSFFSPSGWKCLFRSLDESDIEELSLCHCGLDEARAAEIAKVQPYMYNLRKANLENNKGLTPEGLKLALLAFKNTSVEEVGDIFSGMCDDTARVIAEGLAVLQGLRRLSFSRCGDIDCETWSSLLQVLNGRKLECLHLDHCKLDDEKAEAIASQIAKLEVSALKEVRFLGEDESTHQDYNVTVVSAANLKKTSKAKWSIFCSCKSNGRLLFRTHATSHTTPVWKEKHRISTFGDSDYLEFYIIDEEMGRHVDGLVGKGVLPNWEFHPDGYDDDLVLEKVAHEQETQHHGFFNTFSHHKSKQHFEQHREKGSLKLNIQVLPRLHIGHLGLKKLLQAMKGASVKDLGGIVNELDSAKAKALAHALPGLKTLERLDFTSSWSLSAEEWSRILTTLRKTDKIKELMFCKCRISDKKAHAIADCLAEMPYLRKLKLGWNREVSGRGWVAILEALANTQIEELSLEYCSISDAKIRLMAEHFSRLRNTLSKERLDLSGNFQISESGEAVIEEAFGRPSTIRGSLASQSSQIVPLRTSGTSAASVESAFVDQAADDEKSDGSVGSK